MQDQLDRGASSTALPLEIQDSEDSVSKSKIVKLIPHGHGRRIPPGRGEVLGSLASFGSCFTLPDYSGRSISSPTESTQHSVGQNASESHDFLCNNKFALKASELLDSFLSACQDVGTGSYIVASSKDLSTQPSTEEATYNEEAKEEHPEMRNQKQKLEGQPLQEDQNGMASYFSGLSDTIVVAAAQIDDAMQRRFNNWGTYTQSADPNIQDETWKEKDDPSLNIQIRKAIFARKPYYDEPSDAYNPLYFGHYDPNWGLPEKLRTVVPKITNKELEPLEFEYQPLYYGSGYVPESDDLCGARNGYDRVLSSVGLGVGAAATGMVVAVGAVCISGAVIGATVVTRVAQRVVRKIEGR